MYKPKINLLIALGLMPFTSFATDTDYTCSPDKSAITHSNSFYITINDYQGNYISPKILSYAVNSGYANDWSIPKNQLDGAKNPGCFIVDDDGEYQNPIHCFWEVGRCGTHRAANWFDGKIGDNFSAAIAGDDTGDFHPGKSGSDMNFAWTGNIDFTVYDDQYCDTSRANEPVPTTTYHLYYTIGQSGENFSQIALTVGENIVKGMLHDALCDAAFGEDVIYGDGPKEWTCDTLSVLDWKNTATSFIDAEDNAWILGLQTLSGNEAQSIPQSLSASYLDGNFTTDGNTLSTAVVARLVEGSDNQKPVYRENDPFGDFLVYAHADQGDKKDMTKATFTLSKRLTLNLYDGQNLTCKQLYSRNGEKLPSPYDRVPYGNYTDSCIDIEWNPPVLKAQCKDSASIYRGTSLDFDDACKVGTSVSNIEGNLSCDEPILARPSGSYSSNCRSVVWTGEVLNALCINPLAPDLVQPPTSLNYLKDCMSGSTVSSNSEGQLYCDSPK